MNRHAAGSAALDQSRAVKTAERSKRIAQACHALDALHLPYSPAKVARQYEAGIRRGDPVGDWLAYVDRLLHSGNPFIGHPHPCARVRGGAA